MALTPTLATLATDAAVDAVTALLDGGRILLYAGPPPADADAPAPSAPLVACQLGSPAFAPASGGVANARPIAPGTATAGGTATWFRLVTAGGAAVLDGSVGTAGTNLTLATVAIAPGLVVSLDGLTYAQARG